MVQGIELDRVSAMLFYGFILVLVTFSVVNTFIMIVFERTREFGMLLALGTHPGVIVRQVLLEAVGIPLGDMAEMAQQYYMPDRLYPANSLASLTLAPVVLLIGTQIAALAATGRIWRMRPVEALRAE